MFILIKEMYRKYLANFCGSIDRVHLALKVETSLRKNTIKLSPKFDLNLNKSVWRWIIETIWKVQVYVCQHQFHEKPTLLWASGQLDTVKLSLHSHLKRVKTETCFASGENQRKAHTLAVNNDQQHECWHLHCKGHSASWWRLCRTPNRQECQRERVSQWPMCQRDECWKLLGKRIRAVYVGQVAHCQLLKCANFLKLQSFGLVMNLLIYLPSTQTVWMVVLCSGGKAPFTSAPTSKTAHSTQKRSSGFYTSPSGTPTS